VGKFCFLDLKIQEKTWQYAQFQGYHRQINTWHMPFPRIENFKTHFLCFATFFLVGGSISYQISKISESQTNHPYLHLRRNWGLSLFLKTKKSLKFILGHWIIKVSCRYILIWVLITVFCIYLRHILELIHFFKRK
jgi:hypothetical protein